MSRAFCICALWSIVFTAQAQPFGDWNGDECTNSNDFAGLQTAMNGPEAAAGAGGTAFDFDQTGMVGLAEALTFQAIQSGPALPQSACSTCVRWAGRGRAGAVFEEDNVTGASAWVDCIKPLRLCGTAAATDPAASAAWIGMTEIDANKKLTWYWAQMGYLKKRALEDSPLSPTVQWKYYTEYNSGCTGAEMQAGTCGPGKPDPRYVREFFDMSPGAYRFFSVRLVSAISGRIEFMTDDGAVNDAQDHWGWGGRKANRVDFNGETFNVEDRMSGRTFNPCDYWECAFYEGYFGAPIPVDFNQQIQHVKTNEPTYFGVYRVGPDHVRIWDKR